MLDWESKHHGHHWRVLFTDGGGEFVNSLMAEYCARAGVQHMHSAPYVHDHNGGAERVIRTIVNMACAMMAACDVPPSLWPFAEAYAVVVYNMSHHAALPAGVVTDNAYGVRSVLHSKLQVFGCRAEIKVMKPGAVETIEPDQATTGWFFWCFSCLLKCVDSPVGKNKLVEFTLVFASIFSRFSVLRWHIFGLKLLGVAIFLMSDFGWRFVARAAFSQPVMLSVLRRFPAVPNF